VPKKQLNKEIDRQINQIQEDLRALRERATPPG
jgi:hypothetical protein